MVLFDHAKIDPTDQDLSGGAISRRDHEIGD
jgi:hypothetical protein